jgi:hypothetical protein
MPMRSDLVAMRTSIRKDDSAVASDSIDRMNMAAMNAARSQRRKALTNSITTTSEMNRAETVMRVIDVAGTPLQHAERAMQVPAIMLVIGPPQFVLHGARTIHDAGQAAGQHIECHTDGRDEEYRGQCNLDEMGDVHRLDRIRGDTANAVHGLSATTT